MKYYRWTWFLNKQELMYKIAFDKKANKEFQTIDSSDQLLIADKIVDLQHGIFQGDKPLKGRHKGKFRKRAGNYRIIYLKENQLILITIIRISHRKAVYH